MRRKRQSMVPCRCRNDSGVVVIRKLSLISRSKSTARASLVATKVPVNEAKFALINTHIHVGVEPGRMPSNCFNPDFAFRIALFFLAVPSASIPVNCDCRSLLRCIRNCKILCRVLCSKRSLSQNPGFNSFSRLDDQHFQSQPPSLFSPFSPVNLLS
jgi:hypothetical protein